MSERAPIADLYLSVQAVGPEQRERGDGAVDVTATNLIAAIQLHQPTFIPDHIGEMDHLEGGKRYDEIAEVLAREAMVINAYTTKAKGTWIDACKQPPKDSLKNQQQ